MNKPHNLALWGLFELPGKDLNLDEESQNPITPRRKRSSESTLGNVPPLRRSAGRSDQSEGGMLDADLAALVAAWPTLPDHIRAAIRALVGTVVGPS